MRIREQQGHMGNDDLGPVQEMVRSCIQCGTCTGSCPNSFAMDYTPRTMWRMVLRNESEALFRSRTFSLCSFCYTCTLRCPRGLPLTAAVNALKQLSVRKKVDVCRHSILFDQCFLESIRRHGRVRETEFMMLYFMAMKNPLLPVRFAPLAWKLMRKGKVSLQIPCRSEGRLETLFHKTAKRERIP